MLLIAMAFGPAAFAADPSVPDFVASPATNTAPPRIEFDTLVFDFGRIAAGEIVRHDFVFTNTGSAALEITSVRPSCGCTTAGAWTTHAEPGKTGTIPLSFNSSHFNGPIAKTATVTCNDPAHQQIVLQLRATIWRPIELNPSTAVLNLVEGAESNTPVLVKIVSNLPEPVTLSDPVSSNPGFSAVLKTIQPGKEFQVTITAIPPLHPPSITANIVLKTSSTNAPLIDIPVFASVQLAWVVIPSEITLPPGPLDKPFNSIISIRNNLTAQQTVSAPAIDGKQIPAEIRELIPGRQFTCVLTFPAGFQVDKNAQVILTLTTSDPKQLALQVPVRQRMLPNPNEVGLPTLHRGPVPPTKP
jgi:hypothetical protein